MESTRLRSRREIEIRLAELKGFYQGITQQTGGIADGPDSVKVLHQIETLQWVLRVDEGGKKKSR